RRARARVIVDDGDPPAWSLAHTADSGQARCQTPISQNQALPGMAFAALLGDAATSALDARRGGSSEVLVGGVIGGSGTRSPRCESNVEVQGELVGMRAQPDGIDLVLPLVVD